MMFAPRKLFESLRLVRTLGAGLLAGLLFVWGSPLAHAQQPEDARTVLEALRTSDRAESVPKSVLRSLERRMSQRFDRRTRLRADQGQRRDIRRKVAPQDLTILESQQQFYGSPWPREELNFRPSGRPIRAGDVDGDGADDWVYRVSSVADERTPDLSDRTPKTFLTFGGGDFSARYYDELYYRSLRPVGNVVGAGNADAVRPLEEGFQLFPGGSGGYTEGAVLSEPLPSPNVPPVDLNGDGYDDIVRGAPGESQVTVLFGANSADSISTQTFSPASDTGRAQRFAYAADDIDDDGTGEIVRLQGTTDPDFPGDTDDSLTVDVLALAGPDSLARQQSVAVDYPQETTGNETALSLANVDGTGLKELIARPEGVSSTLVLSTDQGTYQKAPVAYYPGSRPVGDVNGDGRADFALRDTSDGTPYIGLGPASVGDGIGFDLQVPNGPSNASVFLGPSQGDLDDDGRNELIVSYATETQFGPRLLDQPGGSGALDATDFLFDRSAYASNGVQQPVNVGDWNGDGTDDVGFVRTDGRVEIYYGDPTQSISPDVTLTGPSYTAGGVNYSSVAAGDFTGNGTPNLAVAWESDTQTIAVYEAGSGNSPIHTIGIADLGISTDAEGIEEEDDFPSSVVANLGDVNDDGTTDLGVTEPEVETAAAHKAFLFYGKSNLSTQPDVTIDYTDRSVGDFFGQVLRGIGDVNGDGVDDFLVGDTDSQFSSGPIFPPDPFGNGFRGALFVHFGDAGSAPTFKDPDQALAVPLIQQVSGDLQINSFFGFQGIAVGDFNNDDTTDVAAKPGSSSFNSTGNGAMAIRVFHGGSGFDGAPDAELPVPGLLDFFSDTQLAGLNFAAVTAVPPASAGGPSRLVMETYNPSNALVYGPGPDTTYTLEQQTLLRGPDQRSGLGVGHAFINIPQNGAAAVGDFNGSGQTNLVLPQLQSEDFRGQPAYTYELGQGIQEDPPPVASMSQPVDSTSGTVDFGDSTGVDISFSDSTTGADTVTVERFASRPSGAGGIDESTVSEYRLVISAGEGLSVGDSTEVRFDVSMLSGINDPTRVTIYTRDIPGVGAFQEIPTTYDASENELVGLVSGFSEFAFASNTEPLPVELAGFEAQIEEDKVRLTWQTASETGNARFEVQRRIGGAANGREGEWATVGSVDGAGTTTGAQRYRFTDADLPYAADQLEYRLRQVDTDGSAQFSKTVTVDRSVDEVELLGTYPNPAQTRATVRYALPKRQDVTIRLYDLLGRQVRTVVQAEQEGRHERRVDVNGLPSGVYFLRLQAGGQTRTQKLTVVR